MFVLFLFLFLIRSYCLNIDTTIDENGITKTAKGKRFIRDYDLLSYQIVFQLALKQDNFYMISHIQCGTNMINEHKRSILIYI